MVYSYTKRVPPHGGNNANGHDSKAVLNILNIIGYQGCSVEPVGEFLPLPVRGQLTHVGKRAVFSLGDYKGLLVTTGRRGEVRAGYAGRYFVARLLGMHVDVFGSFREELGYG